MNNLLASEVAFAPGRILTSNYAVNVGNFSPTFTPSPTITATTTFTRSASPTSSPTFTISPTPTITFTASPTPGVNLFIDKTTDVNMAAPGDLLTFHIKFGTGAISSPAQNAVITDAVPDNTSLVDVLDDPSLNASHTVSNGTVTWNVPFIATGASGEVAMVVQVNASLASSNVIFKDNFEDYPLNASIPATHPERWQTNSASQNYYLALADPTNPATPNQMAAMLSIYSPLITTALSQNQPYSQYFLVSNPSFSSSTHLHCEFIAPSTDMQDFLVLGDCRVSIDGGFLRIGTGGGYIAQIPPYGWTYGGKMCLDIIYNGPMAMARVNVVDETTGKTTISGTNCSGTPLNSYQLAIWNQAVNAQPNGYLYVDNICITHAVANRAMISAPGAYPQQDCALVDIGYPKPTPTVTASPSSTPTAVMMAGMALKEKATPTISLLPAGKSLIAVPNPAHDQAEVIFKLDQPGRVRLVLVNLLGNSAQVQDLGNLLEGQHVQIMDLRAQASGIYYVVLQEDVGFGFANKQKFKIAVLK